MKPFHIFQTESSFAAAFTVKEDFCQLCDSGIRPSDAVFQLQPVLLIVIAVQIVDTLLFEKRRNRLRQIKGLDLLARIVDVDRLLVIAAASLAI